MLFSLSLRLVVVVVVMVRSEDQFPSIQSLAKSESPEFSVPRPPLDLAETELAKNSPMSFEITQPKLELVPSFTISGFDGEEYRDREATEEKSEPEPLPLEPQIYPQEETVRTRREGD